MKIGMYVFSGTGNTQRVCTCLAKELTTLGHEIEIVSIYHNQVALTAKKCDCLVIGYPVHAFNAPAPVLKFLKCLPQSTHEIPVYLVRTSGEPLKLNNASGITPKKILKKRGYQVLGEFSYVMPYNIIFRHSDGMVSRMWKAAQLRIPQDAIIISTAQKQLNKVNIFSRLTSFALRIEHTAMPIVGRGFSTTNDCIGCGLCAKQCPQNNIAIINGKPEFGKTCVSCMGCAFHCPKNAINTSILNGWRVNGAYQFDANPATDAEVCKYCHSAYLRYFHDAERNQYCKSQTKTPLPSND